MSYWQEVAMEIDIAPSETRTMGRPRDNLMIGAWMYELTGQIGNMLTMLVTRKLIMKAVRNGLHYLLSMGQ